MSKNYLILSEKTWNRNLISELSQDFPEYNFTLIDTKEEFNLETLFKIKPAKIFIPHWSYFIPPIIYENFECIVFHMTDLPYGRGGSPLQNLIVRGFKETMITAIKVVEEIDAGDVYLKRKLSLEGCAGEIYMRANNIISNMIKVIIEENPIPKPQSGEIVTFKRRKPTESDISRLSDLNSIYDYIRMLDAEGYPNAFIENRGIKYLFRNVPNLVDGTLKAEVIIKRIDDVQK